MGGGKEESTEALPSTPPDEPPPLVHALHEELTSTWQYVVADPVTLHAIIIDPHLDNGSATTTQPITIAADRVLAVVRQNGYIVHRIIHTHEPAIYPSSAWYIRAQLLQSTGRAPHVQFGREMQAVRRVRKRMYSGNLFDGGGVQWRGDFEESFGDGQVFRIGNINAHVLHCFSGDFAFVIGPHIFASTSTFDLEVRKRHSHLLGDLNKYRVHASDDRPSVRTVRLMSVVERSGKHRDGGRKMVIQYASE